MSYLKGEVGCILSIECSDSAPRSTFSIDFSLERLGSMESKINISLYNADVRHIYAVIKQIKRSNAVTHLGGLVGNPTSALDAGNTRIGLLSNPCDCLSQRVIEYVSHSLRSDSHCVM
jgi:hypothetical protein